ncbi:MAG TPA: SpoIID/LytB domain-containing protein [Gaiellaceae bacterium]|nr:SpoIID/LytB domain-containing protein [Gaiellaceae bacterium]
MGRSVLVLVAVALAGAGLASGIFAASPGPGVTTTNATTESTTTQTTVTSAAPAVLAVSGHGFGHGLGLSQWGAYGYALHGWTYERILAHYYSGTSLGQTGVSKVRVLLQQSKTVTLGSLGPWSVADAAGAKVTLPASSLKLGAALAVPALAGLTPPLTFSGAEPLLVGSSAYRGRLVVSVAGGLVNVVDLVSLEQYLDGVVPAEMPSNWPADALEAQAVAARSYALANRAPKGPFDLYADSRSQVYGGVAAETPATNAAVEATKGQVLMYAGKVADALYFSTSGGRTASSLDSTGIAIPYLVSVPDPYDSLSPYHDWGPDLFDATKLVQTLQLSGPIDGFDVVDDSSDRVKTLALSSSDDSEVTLSGNQLRTALDLPSTWFTPSLLELKPASRRMTYGGAVSLTGLLLGTTGVELEARPAGLGWAAAGDVTTNLDGRFSVVVKPRVSTAYRLRWGNVRAGLAKVTVAARVSAALTAGGVAGTVRPVDPGIFIQLQEQQPDKSWATRSSTTTDGSSSWSFAGSLAPGTYRIRATPGGGVAPGLSAPLIVS